MGGLAIYLGFAVGTLVGLPVSSAVVGLLIGGAAALLVGLLDEFLTLRPLTHLAGQVLAALIAIVTGVGVLHTISIPTAALTSPGASIPLPVGIIVTVFWLVAMMNTMNFLDGLDGLAGGVAAIAALLLAGWATQRHHFFLPSTAHPVDLIMPLALAGALFGFLVFNWYPARIFMGDSGSMFLGLALAALSIVGPAKLGTALLIFMIPLLDLVWAVIRRQMRGRNFLSGDKQHVYHRMRELGMGHRTIVLLLYSLCIALGILDLELFKLAKLAAFVVLALVIGCGFVLLEIRASRLSQSPQTPLLGRPGRTSGEPAHKAEDQ